MFWYNLACVALICTHEWLVPYQFTFQHIDPILAKFVHDLEIKVFFYQKLGSRRNNSISCLNNSISCFENQFWTPGCKGKTVLASMQSVYINRPTRHHLMAYRARLGPVGWVLYKFWGLEANMRQQEYTMICFRTLFCFVNTVLP